MDLLLKGIILGFTLAIMVGPILFTIIQTSLERGGRAGILVCSGIWTSDFLYISIVFFAFSYVQQIVEFEDFRLYAGIGGGLVLIIFGIAMTYFRTPINKPKKSQLKRTDFVGIFLKGFAINTFNPFTAFFWIALMTSMIGGQSHSFKNAFPFLAGLMGVIIMTDLLKVVFAKTVSKYLKARYIRIFRKISGLALIAFGVFVVIGTTIYPQLLN